MSTGMHSDNSLRQLARTLAGGGHHPTAIALRFLARAGYTTLEQVDSASDLVLLSVPGIGVGRLRAIRGLTRTHWQPPSPQAIHVANWFLSSAQFALRYWPAETLDSLIRGSAPSTVNGGPIEKRIAIDVLSQAVRMAQRHCDTETMVQLMLEVRGVQPPMPVPDNHSLASHCSQSETSQEREDVWPVHRVPAEQVAERETVSDSGHYAFPRKERFEIVRRYRAAREGGTVQSKHAWAEANYHISGKTLLAYEREFPETDA